MIEQSALIETMTGLVIFEIADREFCADIRDVSAIINPAELKQDENLRAEKNPYVNINNLNIPIIPIHQYYSLEPKQETEDQRILIIEPDAILFGFFVDRVKEIFTMSRDFKDKLMFIPNKNEEYLTGRINFEDRTLYLPDFDRIVAAKQ